MLLALVCVGCQSGTSTGSGPSAMPTAAPASAEASLSPPASPTPSIPVALPRPTDIPTDGTCEQNQTCLGLLAPGKSYRTRNFMPQISVAVPTSGWENLSDEVAVFQLLRTEAPGDAIAFFRGARAVNPDGSTAEVAQTVPALLAWLQANRLLAVTSPKTVTVGGLSGVTIDLAIAPGAANRPGDCPVQVCVPLLRGDDPKAIPPWHWDWGSAGTERQRLYLLKAADAVIAIFIDSYDGTTFDSLTAASAPIIRGLRFG